MKKYLSNTSNQADQDVNIQKAFEEACLQLLHRIGRAKIPENRLLRVELKAPNLCLTDWLAAQAHLPRYYWSDRQRYTEMAGIGEAHVVAQEGPSPVTGAFHQIHMYLPSNNPRARYYGGFRFHFNNCEDAEWHDFKKCRFVVPLIELYRKGDTFLLSCTLNGEHGRRSAQHLLSTLKFAFSKQAYLPRFYDRTDTPDYAAWCCLVHAALDDFKHTDLQKVVLARQTVLHARETINPFALLQRLYRKANNVYLFCFQPEPSRAFLGASPECLYQRLKTRIYSEALAGTCPRGNTQETDKVLERSLLNSTKDNREHHIVRESIMDALSGLCTEAHADSTPHIVKLAHCQHLRTSITGILMPDVTDDSLLSTLHPTPAVGGTPAAAAMRWILKKEPFERGIYASPVGWVGADAAEFCVGIRSGLTVDKTLNLYTGAGIVSGSNPYEEWLELDTKLAQFLDILTGDDSDGSA